MRLGESLEEGKFGALATRGLLDKTNFHCVFKHKENVSFVSCWVVLCSSCFMAHFMLNFRSFSLPSTFHHFLSLYTILTPSATAT